MLNVNGFFSLFANCKLVQGNEASAIFDLQRGKYFVIPNDLANFIENLKGNKIANIFSMYGVENENIIKEYFDFLISNDLGFVFEKDELNFFKPLSKKWDFPGLISNAIIDINSLSIPFIDLLINNLEDLGCENVFVTIMGGESDSLLLKTLKAITESSIYSISIDISDTQFSNQQLLDIINNNKRIDYLFLKRESKVESNHNKLVYYDKWPQTNEILFSVNIKSYTEALNYNLYYNRKIFINEVGEYSNTKEFKNVLGNFYHDKLTKISEIMMSEKFNYFGKISKNEIEGCKSCQYKYVCVDSRIPYTKQGKLFLNGKCKYDN